MNRTGLRRVAQLIELYKQICRVHDEIRQIYKQRHVLSALIIEFSRLSTDKLILDFSTYAYHQDHIGFQALRVIQGRSQAAADFYDTINVPLSDTTWRKKSYSIDAKQKSSRHFSKSSNSAISHPKESIHVLPLSTVKGRGKLLIPIAFSRRRAEAELDGLKIQLASLLKNNQGSTVAINRFQEDNTASRHEIRNIKNKTEASQPQLFWARLANVDLFITAKSQQRSQSYTCIDRRSSKRSTRPMSFTSTKSAGESRSVTMWDGTQREPGYQRRRRSGAFDT